MWLQERRTKVPRVGPDRNVDWYSVFGPKIFTAIRDLPDTLADRSIRAHLQKRPKGKKLKRWKIKRVVSEAAPIKQAIEEWARANREEVILADDQMEDLEFLEDREDEIWSPLFVVCSLVAPERVGELKNCALALAGKKAAHAVEDLLSLKLLADVRGLKPEIVKFDEKDNKGKLLTSGGFLVARLKTDDSTRHCRLSSDSRRAGSRSGRFRSARSPAKAFCGMV